MADTPGKDTALPGPPGHNPADAAARARAEAEQRRKARGGGAADEEVGGRGGLDPARYGDWEKDGLISDF